MKFYGSVKMFNGDRGFGFIQRDDRQPDVFVHVTQVTSPPGCEALQAGQHVEFEIGLDPRSGKDRAQNVRVL